MSPSAYTGYHIKRYEYLTVDGFGRHAHDESQQHARSKLEPQEKIQEIVYLNAGSLLANYDAISVLIATLKPLVVCLSETHVTESICESEIAVTGYQVVRCDSVSRHTGGVTVYVRNDCKYCVQQNVSYEMNYWFLLLKIKVLNNAINLGCLYHSPNASHNVFLEFFENFLENVDLTQIYVVVGDFNIRWDLPEDTSTKKLATISKFAGFKQFVNFLTRITYESSSIIDLVFSNDYDIDTFPIDSKISDYETIALNLNLEHPVNNKMISYRNLDFHKISLEIIDYDWMYGSGNVNMVFENFFQNINTVLNNVCPQIHKIEKLHNKKWVNGAVKAAINDRNLANNKFLMTRSHDDWLNYKMKRNYAVGAMRLAKKQFYENKIDQARVEDSGDK
ncbi:unnamed protein product [Callosobruchus maculatus]|uniref:Endonuclease/exonuclease/phosphatase domain-containing protein n=1 Tax=Callosobruchus maculatus TaxID=64391 RepID=A0A653CYN2_CALMS|nr:unnamed protein product [Callosobruchus maculatus]